MPDPASVNDAREALKEARSSVAAEERYLAEADTSGRENRDPVEVALEQGTRVHNMWDDGTPAKIADVAAENAEAEGDDAGLSGVRAIAPQDDPNAADPDVAEFAEDLDHSDPKPKPAPKPKPKTDK